MPNRRPTNGQNRSACGSIRRELGLPDFRRYAVEANEHRAAFAGGTERLGEYLAEVIQLNEPTEKQPANFPTVCPGEMESNRLGAVFKVTDRQFAWVLEAQDANKNRAGRLLEILSQHTRHAWPQGYLLTGRRGLLPSNEKINPVIASKQQLMPQWLNLLEAVDHCRRGTTVWHRASSDEGRGSRCSSLCDRLLSVMAAAGLLREDVPALHVRVVNIKVRAPCAKRLRMQTISRYHYR